MTQHRTIRDQSARDPPERILRADAICSIINGLLDPVIEAGKTNFQYETWMSRHWCMSWKRRVACRAKREHVNVVVPRLGALRTDPKRPAQVVLNLLSNAANSPSAGRWTCRLPGGGGRAELGRHSGDGYAIGMAHEQRSGCSRIFPRRRGNPTEVRRQAGWPSSPPCRAMGGDPPSSANAAGSTFTVSAPSTRHRSCDAGASQAVPAVEEPPAARDGVVLIVDDDPVARTHGRSINRAGFATATAADGLEGLRVARELIPPRSPRHRHAGIERMVGACGNEGRPRS